MLKIENIPISINTIELLLLRGETRYRNKNYCIKRLVISNEIPNRSDIKLSPDQKTLYIKEGSIKCLKDTGDVTCRFGKQLFKFVRTD